MKFPASVLWKLASISFVRDTALNPFSRLKRSVVAFFQPFLAFRNIHPFHAICFATFTKLCYMFVHPYALGFILILRSIILFFLSVYKFAIQLGAVLNACLPRSAELSQEFIDISHTSVTRLKNIHPEERSKSLLLLSAVRTDRWYHLRDL